MYEGTPPWDIGRPQPAFVRLADEGSIEGDVLDCGCGTGENALYLATTGHTVVGIDAEPAAIEQARAKLQERGGEVQFLVGDAIQLETSARTSRSSRWTSPRCTYALAESKRFVLSPKP